VRGAARRIRTQVTEARSRTARRNREATVDEDAVERRDPRLASLVDGRERDVFRALEVADDLPRVQPPSGLRDVA
jgi:hypothetical protein